MDRLEAIQTSCMQLRTGFETGESKESLFKEVLEQMFGVVKEDLSEIKEQLLMRLVSFLADFNLQKLKRQMSNEKGLGFGSSSSSSSSGVFSSSSTSSSSFVRGQKSRRLLKPPEESVTEESQAEGSELCVCQSLSTGLPELGYELEKFKTAYNEDQKFVLNKYPFVQPLIMESKEICDFSVSERADSMKDIGDAQEIEEMLVHISSEIVAGLGVSVLLAERLLVGMPVAETSAAVILAVASANSTINDYRQMNLYGTKVNTVTGGHRLTPTSFNAAAAVKENHPPKRKYYQAFAQSTGSGDQGYGAFGAGHNNFTRRTYFSGFKARKLNDNSALPLTPGSSTSWGGKK